MSSMDESLNERSDGQTVLLEEYKVKLNEKEEEVKQLKNENKDLRQQLSNQENVLNHRFNTENQHMRDLWADERKALNDEIQKLTDEVNALRAAQAEGDLYIDTELDRAMGTVKAIMEASKTMMNGLEKTKLNMPSRKRRRVEHSSIPTDDPPSLANPVSVDSLNSENSNSVRRSDDSQTSSPPHRQSRFDQPDQSQMRSSSNHSSDCNRTFSP